MRKSFLRRALKRTIAYDAYIVLRAAGLRERGWFRSLRSREPVDADGRPIPWYTYPATDFLGPRLKGHFKVFEFGSGNSTLWWAERVNSVVTVEHDPQWFGRIAETMPPSVELLQAQPGTSSYAGAVNRGPSVFDIVVIDGKERNRCAEQCVASLKDDGIVVWDDADREEYTSGMAMLQAEGFRRIDFWGLAPIIDLLSCTAIFYRSDNCLRI